MLATITLLQVPSDDRLDLCARDAVVLAGLNERGALLIEGRLRRQQIEQRRRTERIALLLHAEVLLSRGNRSLLNSNSFFRRTE